VDEAWGPAFAAAGEVAPARAWRTKLAAAVRRAAGARFALVITCVPGRWHVNQLDGDPEGFEHLREEMSLELAPRRGGVLALEESAVPAEYVAEYRRALRAHGVHGHLAGFLTRDDGATLGAIAVGTAEAQARFEAAAREPLGAVVAMASRTINAALALASGFAAPAPQHVRTLDLLTDREREIVELLLDGCSDVNVAHRLQISENTVGSHVTRIFRKLGVHSRSELIARLNSVLVLTRSGDHPFGG
jgi:DNA-binding NarL/FixJ family response regulator